MSTEHDTSKGILLSTVADVFAIEGRGCVVVPGLPHPSSTIPVLRRGVAITLRRADGSEVRTSVRELEMISRLSPVPFTPILLPSPLTKSDVPIGTEIWYFPTADDTYPNDPNA